MSFGQFIATAFKSTKDKYLRIREQKGNVKNSRRCYFKYVTPEDKKHDVIIENVSDDSKWTPAYELVGSKHNTVTPLVPLPTPASLSALPKHSPKPVGSLGIPKASQSLHLNPRLQIAVKMYHKQRSWQPKALSGDRN